MDKKLVVSKTDKKLVGVCGGLGEYFSIDSTYVRLGFIIGALLGGSAVIAYIILAVVMDSKD